MAGPRKVVGGSSVVGVHGRDQAASEPFSGESGPDGSAPVQHGDVVTLSPRARALSRPEADSGPGLTAEGALELAAAVVADPDLGATHTSDAGLGRSL